MNDGELIGIWKVEYDGFGCVNVESNGYNKWLHESPAVSTSADETHASPVLGQDYSGSFNFSLSLITLEQIRQNSAPNQWEVDWVVWYYTDDAHFYYFIAKPNGWELGKTDPDYPHGQRYLATGSNILFPIGRWYNITIAQDGSNIKAYVDNLLIISFTDNEKPYFYGRIGLYNEDAHVHFDNIKAISV